MAKDKAYINQQIKDMFINCINKGYEHFGFEGDFTFIFDDTVQISDNDKERYVELCKACNSDEFYDELHNNAVLRDIDDIDIYEQCMRNHFNDGYALPYVKAIRITGRKDKTMENALREELRQFLDRKQLELDSSVYSEKKSFEAYVKIPAEEKVEDFIDSRSKEKTFNEIIMDMIDASNEKDSVIYKRAWISKETFSNIRKGPGISKMKALQLCVAFKFSYEQTQQMLSKAGLSLGNNKSDYIFEFFIKKGIYDLGKINEALYDNGCKTITKKD